MARTPFPVSDLADARRWLWTYSPVEDWLWERSRPGDVRLPLEARLVCDVFWVSPSQLVRQLRADVSGTILPGPAPARERRHCWGR